jgi:hypothetical protein
MFRALLAHRQQALHKRHFAYCVRVVSVGWTSMVQPTDVKRTQYTSAVCVAPPEVKQVMLGTM